METVVRDIFDFYKSRIESPLFFSFVFSWCGFNHEFLYYLVFFPSEGKVHELLSFRFSWIYDVFLPLIVSVALLTILPVVNNYLMQLKYFLLVKTSEGAARNKKDFDEILAFKEIERRRKQLRLDIIDFEKRKKNFDDEFKTRTQDRDFAERYMHSLLFYALYHKDKNFVTSMPNHLFPKGYLPSDIVAFTLVLADGNTHHYLTASLYLELDYTIANIAEFLSTLEVNKLVRLKGERITISGTVHNLEFK